jgi:hypothetical protein
MAGKKPKRSNEDLAEINDLAVKLVRRELQFYADSPTERVPAALLSTASTLLKSYNVPEQATVEDQIEQSQHAPSNFVPRVSAGEDFTPAAPGEQDGFEGIDADDHANIARRARYLAGKLDESNPERERLLEVARNAEAHQKS